MTKPDPENIFFCTQCDQLRAFVLVSKTKRKCVVCGDETIRPGVAEVAVVELLRHVGSDAQGNCAQ